MFMQLAYGEIASKLMFFSNLVMGVYGIAFESLTCAFRFAVSPLQIQYIKLDWQMTLIDDALLLGPILQIILP